MLLQKGDKHKILRMLHVSVGALAHAKWDAMNPLSAALWCVLGAVSGIWSQGRNPWFWRPDLSGNTLQTKIIPTLSEASSFQHVLQPLFNSATSYVQASKPLESSFWLGPCIFLPGFRLLRLRNGSSAIGGFWTHTSPQKRLRWCIKGTFLVLNNLQNSNWEPPRPRRTCYSPSVGVVNISCFDFGKQAHMRCKSSWVAWFV